MRFYKPTTSKSEKTLHSRVINLWINKNSRIVSCYFAISIEEFLDGEKTDKMIDKKTEETLLKVSDYEAAGKIKLLKKMHRIFIASLIAFTIYAVIDMKGLASTGVYEDIASFSLGLVFGVLLVGTLMTSRYMTKIQAFKRRLLFKNADH